MIKKEVIFHGIEDHSRIIENILDDLRLKDDYFDVKLILTEAITNSFVHGNNRDKNLPITLHYYYDGQAVFFEIEDSNKNKGNINIPDKIEDDEILSESGKGLFLINVLSDEVEINNNVIKIKKIIK